MKRVQPFIISDEKGEVISTTSHGGGWTDRPADHWIRICRSISMRSIVFVDENRVQAFVFLACLLGLAWLTPFFLLTDGVGRVERR